MAAYVEPYMEKLIEEYRQARGYEEPEDWPIEFMTDFSVWLRKRQTTGGVYADFLNNMGLKFEDEHCAEVGMGDWDSVVKPFNTMLITTANPEQNIEPERIIEGDMVVSGFKPILVHNGQTKVIPSDMIKTYMTQNPISLRPIYGWSDIHNLEFNNIILGVYGSVYDDDMSKKIQMLKKFKKRLLADYKEDYATFNDSYFYALGSSREKDDLGFQKRLYRGVWNVTYNKSNDNPYRNK